MELESLESQYFLHQYSSPLAGALISTLNHIALGGHRANHRKIKVNITVETPHGVMVETGKIGGSTAATQVEEKIHECPICFSVFSSGQALGGHKRSHFIGGGAISANVNSITTPAKQFSRIGETLNIYLNLPAPVDDDEISQIMNSAVSDALIKQ
ncbi:Zinc finger protein ZAT4 [Forsythia ovata]|uniref:Zinc finger protein ZAT4 n=1 Tax=Forsythia ovata TaxID=205694 RepID=A0ABD1V034_9LAMI